ncbi:unnamed protein product, partial [marine sediment metagenome]
ARIKMRLGKAIRKRECGACYFQYYKITELAFHKCDRKKIKELR